MGERLRAGIYARVSTEEQASNYSISVQLETNRNLANMRGYEVIDEYIDEGWSGTLLNRPALNRLLNDCRQGKIDIIIVYKLDRFFRDLRHLLNTMEFLEKCNVKFVSSMEPFDTSTSVGRYVMGQFGLAAELERSTFMERSAGGRSKRIREGLWWGGAPYGYDYDTISGKLIINEQEAETVKIIFSMYNRPGETLQSVADYLNSRGIPTKKGLKWTTSGVHDVLSKELYTGKAYIRLGKTKIPVDVPRIIPDEVYEITKKTLKSRKHIREDGYKVSKCFLLKNLLFCGECGTKMSINYSDRLHREKEYKYYYYVCKGYKAEEGKCKIGWIRAELLENAVWKQIAEIITDPEKVRQVYENEVRNPKENSNKEEDVNNIQSKLNKLDVQRKAILNAFRESLINEKDFRDMLKEIVNEEKKLKEKLADVSLTKNTELQVQKFEEFSKHYKNTIENLTDPEKREIILLLIKKISITNNGNIEIVFNPPDEYTVPLTIRTVLQPNNRYEKRKKPGRKREICHVSCSMTKEMWEDIRIEAKRRNMFPEQLMRHCIEDWFDKYGENIDLPVKPVYTRQEIGKLSEKKLSILLKNQSIKKLKEIGAKLNMSVAAIIRNIMNEYIYS